MLDPTSKLNMASMLPICKACLQLVIAGEGSLW